MSGEIPSPDEIQSIDVSLTLYTISIISIYLKYEKKLGNVQNCWCILVEDSKRLL